jgi:hypothetical protein
MKSSTAEGTGRSDRFRNAVFAVGMPGNRAEFEPHSCGQQPRHLSMMKDSNCAGGGISPFRLGVLVNRFRTGSARRQEQAS